jgi:hypothetical protein
MKYSGGDARTSFGNLLSIIHSFYYEGGQTTVYRCQPDKIEEGLSVECGA